MRLFEITEEDWLAIKLSEIDFYFEPFFNDIEGTFEKFSDEDNKYALKNMLPSLNRLLNDMNDFVKFSKENLGISEADLNLEFHEIENKILRLGEIKQIIELIIK